MDTAKDDCRKRVLKLAHREWSHQTGDSNGMYVIAS